MKKIKIITELAEKLYTQKKPEQIKIKEKNLSKINFSKYNKKTTFVIYDITKTQKHKNQEHIIVKDHINKTGENPFRGKQNKIKKQFIDISKMYSKEGVITTCLGKYFKKQKEKNNYPSTTMCNIAIFLKGKGFTKIEGVLINDLKK